MTEKLDDKIQETKHKYHIIAVDDEPAMRNLIEKVLDRSQNFTVYMCATGKEVLERLEDLAVNEGLSTHYHALLTDLNMPEMNGVELARQVKKLTPNMPIYAFSGGFGGQIPDDLFNGNIKKPVSPSELKSTLKTYLDQVYASQRTHQD
ncbi:MAG: response regulator [Candidatus Woesearchaeota archaeon]